MTPPLNMPLHHQHRAVPATPQALADHGVGVGHHFAGGAYIKAAQIPAGTWIAKHAHAHDHLSVLVAGKVGVTVDSIETIHEGFTVLKIEAHRVHAIRAITDATWLCVWATDDTDPETVDQSILKG